MNFERKREHKTDLVILTVHPSRKDYYEVITPEGSKNEEFDLHKNYVKQVFKDFPKFVTKNLEKESSHIVFELTWREYLKGEYTNIQIIGEPKLYVDDEEDDDNDTDH